ncbi:MAG: family 43 glycosylhydrolase [Acidimicrobiales bacterium]
MRLFRSVTLGAAALAVAACSSAGSGAGSTTATSGVTSSAAPTTSIRPPTTAAPARGSPAHPATVADTSANLPDPFILKVPGGYELYASQTGLYDEDIPTAFSKTFGKWGGTRSALVSVPAWATDGFDWAPDVRYLDGQYVMYFDSMAQPSLYYDQQGTGFSHYAQCIGVATSPAPAGPFTGRPSPLICDLAAHGAIDPRTFLATDGELYLDWKSDDNAAAPAAYAVSHLYAQRLSANGLSLEGPPHLLLTADERWQAKIVEAPDMVEARGRFWLFYSGSWFNSANYGVGYASCAGPIGPCADRSVQGPFIGSNTQGQGPGEESLFEDPNGRWWMLYSPWFFGFTPTGVRPIAIAPMAFTTSPYVAVPTSTST